MGRGQGYRNSPAIQDLLPCEEAVRDSLPEERKNGVSDTRCAAVNDNRSLTNPRRQRLVIPEVVPWARLTRQALRSFLHTLLLTRR